MDECLIYDGVGFNKRVVRNMTEEQFVRHKMHNNHYTRLTPEQKEKVLRNIYRLITAGGPGQKNS